jgi:rubrerythrin
MLTHVGALEDQAVLRNLATALEEELKSCFAYRAYAQKADEEGLHGLASLFRATARAEQIHANNHARVIRHIGGQADFDAPEPHVESTFENLRTALVDQRFETDYLYPTFLTVAVPLFDSTAVRSFHWALEADKSHMRLFSNAIARLNTDARSNWASDQREFFVCALCGYAAQNRESENCPGCNLVWDRFETID